MSAKKARRSPVRRAREALARAIDSACFARGETQWTQGYRAGRSPRLHDPEDTRLYDKMIRQYTLSGECERRADDLITKLIRAVRADERKGTSDGR